MSEAFKRSTFTISARNIARIEKLSAKHGQTKTDTINRAVALAAMVDELEEAGGIFSLGPDGQPQKLRFI